MSGNGALFLRRNRSNFHKRSGIQNALIDRSLDLFQQPAESR